MKTSDKKLGMDKAITRRDMLQGIGVLAGGFIAGQTSSGAIASTTVNGPAVQSNNDSGHILASNYYPPALTGLRGSHQGSFEVAHQLARYGRSDWGPVAEVDEEVYDLIVVGAGISGLSAAHFYQKKNPQARILLIDNHDDFGGHAKRNEFKVGDDTLIGYGGAQTMQEPSSYSAIVKSLLDDMGVELKRFETAYDQDFYKRHGLRAGVHFNRKDWGADRVVPFDLVGTNDGYLPVADSSLTAQQAVAQMPISAAARQQFLGLLLNKEDKLSELSAEQKWAYINSISYRDFLIKHLGISEPEVFAILQNLASDTGVGIDACTARSAIEYAGLPGWAAAGFDGNAGDQETEPYIHHFPDGNAGVARLLVRKLIPGVAAGNTMEDIVTAKFDYSKLDVATSAVRLRLNSTVIKVEHEGDVAGAKFVHVNYVNNDKAYRVKGRACVLACYNAIIPHLCPSLPKPQQEALSRQVKTPILYTSVAIRNWQAWKKLGIGAVVSPSDYHVHSKLDFPVSLGGYKYSAAPDQPVIVHMERFPHRNNEGLTSQQQKRLGRQELFTTSFETIERHTRTQLASMLGEGGFDPARDILGITVNRWAHGYASWYNPLFETVYDDWQDERYPHMKARKPFGRITIANSDAAANAMFESAVEEGYRAVTELK